MGRDILQFFAGDQWFFQQRTAAAREQKQHGILRGQPAHQFQRLFGGGKTRFVWHRMGGFIAGHAGDLALYVAVFGDDHTAVRLAQHLHGGIGHLPGGFASRNQEHPPRRGKALQRTAHGFIRQYGADACCYDGFGLGTQGGVHGKDSLL